jgi:hypothetical protein
MSKSRTVRAALGLPLVAALALTSATGCGLLDEAAKPVARPSAANGIDKLSPSQAFTRASKATLSARSVRMRARVKEDKAGVMHFDYQYSGRDRAKGTMRIGRQRLDIIKIGKVQYQRGNKAYHEETGSPEAASELVGKWLKSEPKSGTGFGAISGAEDLEGLFKEVGTDLQGWTMGKLGNIGGTPSVALNGADEQIHIAAQGPPYVLRLNSGGDYFDFFSYNAPVSIKKPPANLILETSG